MPISRRTMMAAGVALLAASIRGRGAEATDSPGALSDALRAIEGQSGGRLGVGVLDTATGARSGYRETERFPLCSTIKVLACAAVLARVDAGQDSLDRRVVVVPGDLLGYAPVTRDHVGGAGMTLGELCAAAITLSDNTAANLIVASLGGPTAVTAFARTLGDLVTRLDRTEPTLNTAMPGDPRDTTTPDAMAATLRRLVLGDALSRGSRDRLVSWMKNCQTGLAKLRAGVPPGWTVGDKTGSGDHGTTNDIAVLWPPNGRTPLVLSVYMTGTTTGPDAGNGLFAAVARAVVTAAG